MEAKKQVEILALRARLAKLSPQKPIPIVMELSDTEYSEAEISEDVNAVMDFFDNKKEI